MFFFVFSKKLCKGLASYPKVQIRVFWSSQYNNLNLKLHLIFCSKSMIWFIYIKIIISILVLLSCVFDLLVLFFPRLLVVRKIFIISLSFHLMLVVSNKAPSFFNIMMVIINFIARFFRTYDVKIIVILIYIVIGIYQAYCDGSLGLGFY